MLSFEFWMPPILSCSIIRQIALLDILIFKPSKVGEEILFMEEKHYQSPAAVVLELYPEGVLCSSSGTETLGENEGVW